MSHDVLGTLDLTGVTIETVANPGSRANLGLNTAHYTKITGPLFPALPSVADIKQQSLADCYLLASVIAILARDNGPETVEGMMRDRGTDVVVRLFDKKGTPRYVAIERSIRKNSEKHNGGAIWASLLEKAYAAAAFVEEGKKFSEGGQAAKPGAGVVTGWAKLSFGSSTAALQVLLGTEGKNTQIDGGLISGAGNDGPQFRDLFSVEKDTEIHESVRANLRDKIFNGDGHLLDRFLLWRTVHVEKSWRTLLDAHGDVASGGPPSNKDTPLPRKAMRLDDIADFFAKHGLAADVAAPIMSFAEAKQLVPGKRGSGIYSTSQLNLYARIARALKENKPVTLATMASVGTAISAKGKSGGESIVKGLAGTHAYAVISIREDTASPQRKWVRVRNPWGEVGRRYDPSPKGGNALNAVATTDGEFDLELSDVTKRFDKIHVAGVAL